MSDNKKLSIRAERQHQKTVARRRRTKTFTRVGIPMDRNSKARVVVRAKGWSALNMKPGQHIGPITHAFWRVLYALLFGAHNSRSGACYPSYAKIAELARCKRSTVHAAINLLEDAGILTWSHGIVRERVSEETAVKRGWKATVRVIRTSNVYRFFDPNPNAENANNQKSENRPGTPNQYKEKQVSKNPQGVGGDVSTLAATKAAQKPPGDSLSADGLELLQVLHRLGTAIAEREGLKPA